MQLKLEFRDPEWWFWPIILVFMIAGTVGWQPGFDIAIAIAIIQLLYSAFCLKSVTAFPVQVRILYTSLVICALWVPYNILYILLILGTMSVTFTGNCILALFLKIMPWNKGIETGTPMSCDLKDKPASR